MSQISHSGCFSSLRMLTFQRESGPKGALLTQSFAARMLSLTTDYLYLRSQSEWDGKLSLSPAWQERRDRFTFRTTCNRGTYGHTEAERLGKPSLTTP